MSYQKGMNSDKEVKLVIIAFFFINLILLASMRLLPFIDLPNHLAEATIFKLYDGKNLLSQYYKPVTWYFPNTFHPVFCSLFPSVEWGNKVFHILYIILLHTAVYLVIKKLNGNPWYGLLAILFTFNYNVTFGFVGFAMSIPFLIFLFYMSLSFIATGKAYYSVVISALLVLLFFMHAQNALLGLLLYSCLLLFHFRRTLKKAIIPLLLPSLPVIFLIVMWWIGRSSEEETSTLEYLKNYYASAYLQTFIIRLRIIVFDNFQLREGIPGLAIAGLFFLAVLLPLLLSKPWRRSNIISNRTDIIHAGLFFLLMTACYVFAPDKLPGQSPVFQRFCTITILSLIILISAILKDERKPWLKYFVMVAVSAYTILWAEYIYSFNRQNRAFNEALFDGILPHSTLAGLIYENDYRGRKVYIHFPNYFTVWSNGISASKIIDYRFGVVRRVERERDLPSYDELIGDHYTYLPQYQNMDFLLVRGVPPVTHDRNVHNFSLWREVTPWRLYQNRQTH